ncbi:MAG: glycerol-3-phosphate 1-O-acyltransferase PlsY [Agathobacter sp.]|nr:glycerol-3-phosphate 1-O-acyltransferase PlsY [Agathobacter sp.]
MIYRLGAVVIGYLFGTIQTGYIYGKIQGVDIRKQGSGNTGATNSLRTFGLKGGLITFLGDLLKTVLAILFVQILFGNVFGEDVRLLRMYAGMGAILGHNFPFYLNFKGGKGIACSLGLVLMVYPMAAPLCLVVFFVTVILSKYVSLGSILAVIMVAIQVILFNANGILNLEVNAVIEVNVLTVLLSGLAIFQHRTNIGRLLNGTENKIGKKM